MFLWCFIQRIVLFMGFEVDFVIFISKNMWALSFYRSMGFYRGIPLSIKPQNLKISSELAYRSLVDTKEFCRRSDFWKLILTFHFQLQYKTNRHIKNSCPSYHARMNSLKKKASERTF